jgi:hypothetical protein
LVAGLASITTPFTWIIARAARFGKNSPILGRKRQDKPDLYRIASLAQICKFQIVLLIGRIS